VLHDEEREQRAEAQVGHLDKVAGPDIGGVVAQEGGPRLTAPTWRSYPTHIFLDRPLAERDAQLEEFAADVLRAPEAIIARHRPD